MIDKKLFPFIICVIFVVFAFRAEAQYFSTGQDPARVSWRQINTEHFQIIFPEEYESKAQQLAFVFDKVYDYGQKTLNHSPKKISIILHTQTAYSNGLVGWSPRRVELFATPHQGIYAQDWLEQLAVHEFRHVVQLGKIQSELPGIIKVLFGEQATAAAIAAYLPFWFIEGDAVITETSLTNSGRGRLSSFLMQNKAQVVEKGLYSYDKASLGSYKDFVPNRYRFGYWLTAAIRKEYGAGIWEEVLSEVGSKPLSISPLNRVLKKYSGLKKEALYTKVFQHYENEWNHEYAKLQLTETKQVIKKPKFYTDYQCLFVREGDEVIALKKSRDDIDHIVKISNGKEKVLFTPGSIYRESISGRENLLIWSERRPHIRWEHADKSVIIIYNIDTKVKKVLKFGNNLFAPAISPSLKYFAAVEITDTNDYNLSVFDINSGEKIDSFSTKDNQFFLTPCWSDTDEKLYMICLSDKGKYLASYSLTTKAFTNISPVSFHDIRNPIFHGGKILYTASYTGIDNIYSLDPENKEITQLSSVPFGADYPFQIGNHLYFSNYSSEGYHIASMNTSNSVGETISKNDFTNYHLADQMAKQENAVLSFNGKTEAEYESRKYSKLANLFNFHSWSPAYMNINDYELRPGFSIFSQNKLGTAETHLGYEYEPAEEAGKFKVGFNYSGFHPIIDTEISFGKRSSNIPLIRQFVNDNGDVVRQDTITQNISWNELNFEMDVRLPFRFNNGKYSQLIQPSINYEYEKLSRNNSTPENFIESNYSILTPRVYFQNILRQSELSILPRWGQAVDLIYRNTPLGGIDIGSLSAAQMYLYFPGVSKTHGLRFYAGFQEKGKDGDGNITFSDVIKRPRGTSRFQNNEMVSFSVDYAMPLLYPDLSLGVLAYIQRLRASFFYDYTNYKGNLFDTSRTVLGQYEQNIESIGVELIGDGHFMRLVAPVSAGVRGMYHPHNQSTSFQFLVSVNFNGI